MDYSTKISMEFWKIYFLNYLLYTKSIENLRLKEFIYPKSLHCNSNKFVLDKFFVDLIQNT